MHKLFLKSWSLECKAMSESISVRVCADAVRSLQMWLAVKNSNGIVIRVYLIVCAWPTDAACIHV